MLAIWLRPLMSPWQHGGQPGKGPTTAWAELLRKVITARDIYEYDLKGFFNSFKLSAMHLALHNAGVPESVNQRLYEMNDRDATPPSDGKIHPSDPELAEHEVQDYSLEGMRVEEEHA